VSSFQSSFLVNALDLGSSCPTSAEEVEFTSSLEMEDALAGGSFSPLWLRSCPGDIVLPVRCWRQCWRWSDVAHFKAAALLKLLDSESVKAAASVPTNDINGPNFPPKTRALTNPRRRCITHGCKTA